MNEVIERDTRGNSNAADNAAAATTTAKPQVMIECKLCLTVYPEEFFYKLEMCGCLACEQCMTDYVEAMLEQDRVLQIPCPVQNCAGAYLTTAEIKRLLDETHYARYCELKYLKEVEVDPWKIFCPRPGCENLCPTVAQPPPDYERKILERAPLPIEAWEIRRNPTAITCSKCDLCFCSVCKTDWHQELTCDEANAQLKPEERSILYYSRSNSERDELSLRSLTLSENIIESSLPKFIDVISECSEDEDEITTKPCPVCALPIERDLGCAKIQCVRCNHQFCWHCLEILDEDFMWMHYEKGPCKGRIGITAGQIHSYRITAVLTMAGIGLLVLIASPVIILAGPCFLCYKYAPRDKRNDDGQQSETSSLQSSEGAERGGKQMYTESSSNQQQQAPSTSAAPRDRFKEASCPKKNDSIFSFCRIL